jgi:hypothetical protein
MSALGRKQALGLDVCLDGRKADMIRLQGSAFRSPFALLQKLRLAVEERRCEDAIGRLKADC